MSKECKTAIFTLLLSGQSLRLEEVKCILENRPSNETNNNNTQDKDQNNSNSSEEKDGTNTDLNNPKYIHLKKYTTT